MVLISFRTFSEMIKPTPRNIEHAIANKFPIVYLLEKSNWLLIIIVAPKMANPKPNKRNFEWCLFKINFSIMNVNKGASVPRNVALAMVVNFIDPKKRAKWMPSIIPANHVRFNCLLFNGVCFLNILMNHKIIAPKLILQK